MPHSTATLLFCADSGSALLMEVRDCKLVIGTLDMSWVWSGVTLGLP